CARQNLDSNSYDYW
nr:immunoglobulin heavy chain junction region [Macaca mulatta]